ncbi:ATP-dependent helicase HrpB [Pyxidicoccus parkwayensis]|uniref:ATP-dependent helicase HrpB n=1 Tax=Pyxidicoccus parkwayensis TaxID=2813578 RepID=A0ABX7NTV9_9BACT|nr:ATP-dependent helicase HrpB [Pyxidicoccus parkwaysis]QSQ21861.1 ATP-dependent helicase HrpB [Pyxidicoccus parkwaysis]
MTSPMTGVPPAQPLPAQQQVAAVEKQGESRFDGVLADKARDLGSPAVQTVHAVEEVARTERPVLNAVTNVVHALEQGQRDLDRIIQAASSGKPFSNAELLSLQASMYRYTQELDLVSRVVEKATTGLKDVVKTQV